MLCFMSGAVKTSDSTRGFISFSIYSYRLYTKWAWTMKSTISSNENIERDSG